VDIDVGASGDLAHQKFQCPPLFKYPLSMNHINYNKGAGSFTLNNAKINNNNNSPPHPPKKNPNIPIR